MKICNAGKGSYQVGTLVLRSTGATVACSQGSAEDVIVPIMWNSQSLHTSPHTESETCHLGRLYPQLQKAITTPPRTRLLKN